MRFFKYMIVALSATLLISCGGPFTRVVKPEYTNTQQGYALQLPVGWVQATGPQAKDSLWVTKDGFSLQSIRVDALKPNKAFETIKKEATTTTVISDLSEMELAEFKAKNPNAASVTLVENTLAKVAGQKSYRLHIQYLNDKGLRLEQVTYGFVTEKNYYRLAYQAPTLHYFKRDIGDFEKLVASFTVNPSN